MSLEAQTEANYPKTEGIKYAGSKLKLLPAIHDLISSVPARSIFDGFSGTTRVAQMLARKGCQVATNDISVWSRTFATCYLKNDKLADQHQPLIDHLNQLKPRNGWFTEHYGGRPTKSGAIQSDGLKRPWQVHNTQRLDAIRDEIDQLNLSEVDKAVALTSLILALDKVDNTLGHFVSYLKDWSPRSYQSLQLKVPNLLISEQQHTVFQGDIFDVLPKVECDLAYFDPPYGSNNAKMPPSRVRYASYYHLWKTVCLNDQPELVGKSKRRVDCSDQIASTVFEDFRKDEKSNRFVAVLAIEKLIRETQANWIVLSYSNGGRATKEELFNALQSCGKIKTVHRVDYRKNVMASMRWTDEWLRDEETKNVEFLFLLEKQ